MSVTAAAQYHVFLIHREDDQLATEETAGRLRDDYNMKVSLRA